MPKMQLSAQSCVSNIVLLLDIVICFLVHVVICKCDVLVTVCYILIIVAIFK